jgi:hypothetical protein
MTSHYYSWKNDWPLVPSHAMKTAATISPSSEGTKYWNLWDHHLRAVTKHTLLPCHLYPHPSTIPPDNTREEAYIPSVGSRSRSRISWLWWKGSTILPLRSSSRFTTLMYMSCPRYQLLRFSPRRFHIKQSMRLELPAPGNVSINQTNHGQTN